MMCTVSSLMYILLADDTIFRSDFDIKLLSKKVSHEVNALSQWFSINKLLINLEKLEACYLQI